MSKRAKLKMNNAIKKAEDASEQLRAVAVDVARLVQKMRETTGKKRLGYVRDVGEGRRILPDRRSEST